MIRRIVEGLGSLKVTVVGLFLLLVLTIWGTFYQVDHGLYGAQERFYQSWFFSAGGLPFPGAQTVMVILFVNLIAAMIVLGSRGRLRWGLIVTHLGLLMMLSAGAVTFYFGQEAQLSLEEGQSSNVAISFTSWELSLQGNDAHRVSALDARRLRPREKIPLPGGKQFLRVEEYYRNCEPKHTSTASGANGSQHEALVALPRDKEPSQNIPGMIFTLYDGDQSRGRFLVWGGDNGPTPIPDGAGGPRWIGLRRLRTPLPAEIELEDFRREMHPGSGIAKSYSSLVLVRPAKELERKALISMNKPLRLQGFTFYQSSYSSAPGGREISVFQVVRNYGRHMPYIATGLTVAGMAFHFTGLMVARMRRKAAA